MAVILNAIKTRAFGDTVKELVPEIRWSLLPLNEGRRYGELARH